MDRKKKLSMNSRAGTRRLQRPGQSTPHEIYDDLLREALSQSPQEHRPLKKRKSQRDPSEVIVLDDTSSTDDRAVSEKGKEVMIVDSSSDEDEDEMEWDEVDLTAMPMSEDITESETTPATREVTLSRTPQKHTRKRAPTVPRNALARKTRLEAHKMHLLSLLASFRNLNSLLSSPSLLKLLRRYVPPATVNALNTGPEHTQARRTIAFLSGLRDLTSTWKINWKETKRGWRRPRWVDSEDLGKIPAYLDMNEAISLNALCEAAKTRSGSRDVGAWLFTAILRSVGVETRLVCSLQPLQFGFTNEGDRQDFNEIPSEKPTSTEMIKENSHITISSDDEPKPSVIRKHARNLAFPSSSNRNTATFTTPAEYIVSIKTYSPNHPFFWSEVWDVSSQKWIAVEPMVGARVNQPSKIEPPGTAAPWETGSIGDNIMTYVVGFDNSGYAKDVTKRYTKAFHSKTWRNRIESIGGEKWWTRILKSLDREEKLDRDQLEDIDLSNHLLKEPIPKKIDDFRHHPLYVLERHIKRNEILASTATHVSALTSGKGLKFKTEKVYKRKDVIPCFTAREWFRRGRIIKQIEQPLKYNPRKRTSSDEEDISTPLYAESQTEIYVPPSVINGVIPKNDYGNIDIYTPSMVPAGGVHVIRPSIALAAQFAGIDYADAVTGFDFVKKKASARVNGIIVAEENVEGLLVVWDGMMERVEGEEERRRVNAVLERWRRFAVRMGVMRGLNERHGRIEPEHDFEIIGDNDEDGGGGFLRGAVQDGREFEMDVSQQGHIGVDDVEVGDEGGGFLPNQSEFSNRLQSRFEGVAARSSHGGIHTRVDDESSSEDMEQLRPDPRVKDGLVSPEDIEGGFEADDDGGGFIQEDDDSDGGGFLYEEEDGLL